MIILSSFLCNWSSTVTACLWLPVMDFTHPRTNRTVAERPQRNQSGCRAASFQKTVVKGAPAACLCRVVGESSLAQVSPCVRMCTEMDCGVYTLPFLSFCVFKNFWKQSSLVGHIKFTLGAFIYPPPSEKNHRLECVFRWLVLYQAVVREKFQVTVRAVWLAVCQWAMECREEFPVLEEIALKWAWNWSSWS